VGFICTACTTHERSVCKGLLELSSSGQSSLSLFILNNNRSSVLLDADLLKSFVSSTGDLLQPLGLFSTDKHGRISTFPLSRISASVGLLPSSRVGIFRETHRHNRRCNCCCQQKRALRSKYAKYLFCPCGRAGIALIPDSACEWASPSMPRVGVIADLRAPAPSQRPLASGS
jgi:hypothetical protein